MFNAAIMSFLFCRQSFKNANPLISRKLSTTTRNYATMKMLEVGRFQPPLLEGKYRPGQLFVHRVLGYRGVVLLPRAVRVTQRGLAEDNSLEEDGQNEIEEKSETGSVDCLMDIIKTMGKESSETYYQVLVDKRDAKFMDNAKTRVESVTFMDLDSSEHPLDMLGMDYCSHEDLLPYESRDSKPLLHPYAANFFTGRRERKGTYTLKPRTALSLLQAHKHHWLELADVYKEVTEDIRVTVMPFYMGKNLSLDESQSFWWRYIIRLENLSTRPVQLVSRSWRVYAETGHLERHQGRGVLGLQPVLDPTNPAFQYNSQVFLQCPNGKMWGSYQMEREDGSRFDVRVPTFKLESNQSAVTVDS